MEMRITADQVVQLAALLGGLSAIGGLGVSAYRFYVRQKLQDRELSAIRSELVLLCHGVKACLQGLSEQGCDGPVHDALNRLDKHLNKAAHRGEDL